MGCGVSKSIGTPHLHEVINQQPIFYYKLQNHLNARNDFAYMLLDADQKGVFDEVAYARKRTITIEEYK